MKAFCAPCRSEGREAFIGERPPFDDPREAMGVCWRHKLQTLKRANERENPRDVKVRFLIVVARHASNVFGEISEQFLDDARVEVFQDRRRGERRKARAIEATDRRLQDRRRTPGYWEDMRYHPVVIVPTWRPPEPRIVTAPSPALIQEVTSMGTTEMATPAWPGVDTWVRETQHILSHVLPQMVQDSEELRRRAESAEDQVSRLKRELTDLQSEVGRLGGEVDRLNGERTALTEAVHRGMAGIARLADDVSAALKSR
jgi:hypothetical protein